jgi:hypothetical protein
MVSEQGILIPDHQAANAAIEAGYQDLLREQYILFRHFHMSVADQDRLTSEDRRTLIEKLVKEREDEARASSGAQELRGPSDAAMERGG